MKESHYYVLTDSSLKQHIIRFIKEENNKLVVYDVKEKLERQLHKNVSYYEAPLTHTHLYRLGFMNFNHQFFTINGDYVFPLNAVGSNPNGLSCLLLGYSIVPEKDAFNFLSDFKEMTKEIIAEEKKHELQEKLSSTYSINTIIDHFKFVDHRHIDSIILD